MKQFNPLDYRIFEGITGSRLYGTATPDSDFDYREICIPPLRVTADPFMSFNVKDSFENEDRAIYDLGKFMNLCADANPNIIELLFIPEEFTILKTEQWDKVIENRQLFLSKNVKHRFLGYSFSQLDAIKRHREWFVQPPDHKPTREEFGLKQTPLVSEANLQNVLAVPHNLFLPEHHQELIRERAYRDAKKKWDNYMQWNKNRNPKRKGTEEQFGYDSKYASHLFRLMSEGEELLMTGNITFPLPNAEWLLEIKNGLYKYEQILEMAQDIEKKFDTFYEQSPLPHSPNRNALKELYFDIIGV